MSRDRKDDTIHREIAQRRLGRPLAANEVAHHVNEDKSHNTNANIAIQQRGTHTSAHNRGREVSKVRAALRMVKERRKLY